MRYVICFFQVSQYDTRLVHAIHIDFSKLLDLSRTWCSPLLRLLAVLKLNFDALGCEVPVALLPWDISPPNCATSAAEQLLEHRTSLSFPLL